MVYLPLADKSASLLTASSDRLSACGWGIEFPLQSLNYLIVWAIPEKLTSQDRQKHSDWPQPTHRLRCAPEVWHSSLLEESMLPLLPKEAIAYLGVRPS